MGGVFISYRREDSQGSAGRLYDDLKDRLGDGLVYRDVDTIEPGVDYVAEIVQTIEDCDALVAVIGRSWLGSKDKAENRRLDSEGDLVRLEIASALEGGKVVIPVLVEDAAMPSEAELPAPLAPLASRNALPVSDLRWNYDVGRLAVRLEKLLHRPPAETTPPTAPQRSVEHPDPGVGSRQRGRGWVALAGATAGMVVLLVLHGLVAGGTDDPSEAGLTTVTAATGSTSPDSPPQSVGAPSAPPTTTASRSSVKPFTASDAKLTKTDGTVFTVRQDTLDFGLCSTGVELKSGQSIAFDRVLAMAISDDGSSRYTVGVTLLGGERIEGDLKCLWYRDATVDGKNSVGTVKIPMGEVAHIDFRQ